MAFQVGEKVVYANHGIATIENISSRSFGAHQERFYLLRLSPNRMTVMVPFSHAQDVGLRKVTKCSEVNRVLAYLAAGRSSGSTQDWKDRFKENSDKMHGGNLVKVAEVFKALLIIQLSKTLSFREKRMLERARSMLVLETSIAKSVPQREAEDLIQRALAKCNLPMPPAL
ncbi:MAG: CarD family transcriptional regulator [Acidobacteriaceae bacterium]|nr:CarD family transcriptional regulator [Acidobacteriaceae bacterium]MBV9779685.1 CarD family transcriptional regulator [Acidobacteriaceae bacterium]